MTSLSKCHVAPADPDHIEQAASILKAGGLVAFPTETVYGLGGDARSDKCVAKIFKCKKRPAFNPLIIHIKNIKQAYEFAEFNSNANKLTSAFWPGALTLILKRKKDAKLSLLATAGLDTVAVRVPNHPVAQSILAAANMPIAAPSANLSGTISSTQASHVDGQFSGHSILNMIIDGGPCTVGLESTIVDVSGDIPTLLRPGGLAIEDIEDVIGPLAMHTSENIIAPGQMTSHYAPTVALRMNVKTEQLQPGESLLAFGPDSPPDTLNLSPTANLTQAAANLFAMMRALDKPGTRGIAVMEIPNQGLGIAINDRLKRASAKR